MTEFSFQLHKIEVVNGRPSELYGDNICLFSTDAVVKTVPMLHVFGRTNDGSSVCVKIRNAYPYFFVDLPHPYNTNPEYICEIGSGINFALTGISDPDKSLVHKIELVHAYILYHYDSKPRLFLKISLYNPYQVKRATDAFQTGRIGGQPFRCYESHIPFVLQVMIDFNLFGMDLVDLKDFNLVEEDARESSCDIELECSACQILNPEKLQRFGNLRQGASGVFPSCHVMPSVVSMLENLGLGTAATSQRRRVEGMVSLNHVERYRDILKRSFEAIPDYDDDTIVSNYPKACHYGAMPIPVASQTERLSSFWDQHSFAFSSQQIKRASIGFKVEQIILPEDEENDGPIILSDVEEILQEMLQDPEENDLNPNIFEDFIPQFDGACDDFNLHNMWSDNSYESSSLGGPPEFKSDMARENWIYKNVEIPPSTQEMLNSLRECKVPRQIHQTAYQSTENEVSLIPGSKPITITPVGDPPISYSEALKWIKSKKDVSLLLEKKLMSQIEGPTQICSRGYNPDLPTSSQLSRHENLSILSVECFGDSSGKLLSNPENDQILMVAWSFLSSVSSHEISLSGVIILTTNGIRKPLSSMRLVNDEKELFDELIKLVNDLDPDILCGFEIESNSWGHLHDRSRKLGLHLSRSIGRSLYKRNIDPNKSENEDPYAAKRTSTFHAFGRICLNIWRIVSSELSLRSYSFESVAFHIMHESFPKYRQSLLRAFYYGDSTRLPRIDVLANYFLTRSNGNISLLVKTEVLNRTCEFARLYGIEFFSVVSRGSQYKVESLMIRLAHLENFVAYSPSKADVVRMAAPESLPLVMEPKSGFYVDPVVVLDFQALYPSIIIAYNYCFSTCLGRVNDKSFPKVFGSNFLLESSNDFSVNIGELIDHENITVSPNRVAFVTKEVRQGILPKMLSELLEARIAVKAELSSETDPMRRRILDARQLGLKLISNVTYGYTSASFTGRMPCVEIADSIVQTGRATLEQAVKWIHENKEWNAEVVYGDTDSLFIKLPGRTLSEAHELGQDIAAFISSMCPPPVKLKFEKVYHPCFLMSKKRYVGFKYERPSAKESIFDAKGIETVRRDGCPLISKILEKTLKILARTKDISQVKNYVQRQFQKVLAGGNENLSDFVFCKEVRLGTYAADRVSKNPEDEEEDVEAGSRPHSAIIALQRIQQDPRDAPQYAERVPYVIVYGEGNNRLRELVASPDELLYNPNLRLNSVYYIVKCLIPALNRVLGLVGVDTFEWYSSLPRPISRPINAAAFVRIGKQKQVTAKIENFFKSSSCINCCGKDAHELSKNGGCIVICRNCSQPSAHFECIGNLLMRLKEVESEINSFYLINNHHHGFSGCLVTDLGIENADKLDMCWSHDCPLFWKAIVIRQISIPLRLSLLSALTTFGVEL